MGDETLVGVVLLLLVPVLVLDGVIEVRAGYTGDFWRKSLDDKLDVVAGAPAAWLRLGTIWAPAVTVAAAGLAAFSIQLADAGEATLAFLALGAFLTGAFAWLIGVIVQTTAAARAAEVRAATGSTPDWMPALWQTTWWTELTHIVTANVAFVLWGIAVLDAGYPSTWAGWALVGLGGVTLLGVAITRDGFPQLAMLAPIVLGVALVVA